MVIGMKLNCQPLNHLTEQDSEPGNLVNHCVAFKDIKFFPQSAWFLVIIASFQPQFLHCNMNSDCKTCGFFLKTRQHFPRN